MKIMGKLVICAVKGRQPSKNGYSECSLTPDFVSK
ncbi:Uncharacterised protein [Campylobacter jejuni]|jgi:hypothetical protein|nr:Uncharacterised protein [Campylobacter jejuni]